MSPSEPDRPPSTRTRFPWPLKAHRAAGLTLALAAILPIAASAQRNDLTLTEKWRARGVPGVMAFGAVEGIVETDAGEIWVSDPIGRAVLGLDSLGRRGRIVAREGDGPGEVRSPTLSARIPSGGVAIYDQGHDAVELFGRDGRFVRRVTLSAKVLNPKGLAVLPNGQILLSGGLASGGGGAVHRFAANGRLLGSWGAVARARNERAVGLISGGPLAVLREGSVLYSQAAPHMLAIYSPIGKRHQRLAADRTVVAPIGDAFIQVRGNRRVFQWRFPQSAGVFRLPDNDNDDNNDNVLNVVWNAEANTSTWEVYHPSGALVVRKRFARAYRPWALTRSGDVMATVVDATTGEATVVRLGVQVREPNRPVTRLQARAAARLSDRTP
jgi:hypothetical protein